MSGLWVPRGFQQPPVGARINWSHPFAAGLVGLWVPGVGNAVEPSVVNASHALVPSAEGTRAVTSEGVGLDCVGSGSNGAGWAYTVPDAFKIQPPCTLIVDMVVLASGTTGATNPRVFSLEYTSTDSPPYICMGFFRWTSGGDAGRVAAAFNSTANIQILTGLSAPAAGAHIQVAMVLDTPNARYYQNGILVNSNSAVGTIAYSSLSRIIVGSVFASGGTANCAVTQAAILSRALTQREVLDWYAEPYAMLTR